MAAGKSKVVNLRSAANDRREFEALVKRFPLRPIRSDSQNNQAATVCDSLTTRRDKLSAAEQDYLEVLTDLILKYESKWDDDAKTSPLEMVKFLMEQNNLAQKDLVPQFGSPSRVSEFLKGERRLSIEQAKRLSERFYMNISAFID